MQFFVHCTCILLSLSFLNAQTTNKCSQFTQSTPSSQNSVICLGDSSTLQATANLGHALYWYDAASQGNLLHIGNTFTVNPTSTTYYWVAESNGCCFSNRTRVRVRVKQLLPPPIATDDISCNRPTMTLNSSSTSGASAAPLNWYDAPIGGNLIHSGNQYTFAATTDSFWVEESEQLSTGNQLDNGQDQSSFSGMSRGYFFTAPTDFILSGLRVPTDRSSQNQSVEVIKFNNTGPPSYPSTSNSFVSLFKATNVAGSSIIPCQLNILQGETIAIIGSRGNNSVNSYGSANYQTSISGIPITLERCGMQSSIASNNANNIWGESHNPIGRVEMYYDASFGCTSMRTKVKANISEPQYANTNSIVLTNSSCTKNEAGIDWTYYYHDDKPDKLLFAVAHDPNNLGNNNFTATIEISTSQQPDNPTNFTNGIYKSENLVTQHAYFSMGRYWNFSYSGTLIDPVHLRFYFSEDEKNAIKTAADNWVNQSYGGQNNLYISNIHWFNTINQNYEPSIALHADSIHNSRIFSPYSINESTTSNAVNYVQLDNVDGASGGTAAINVYPGHILNNDLLSFNAKKIASEKVQLQWQIMPSPSIAGFEVQRSSDGIEFNSMGYIEAQANQGGYAFTDVLPISGYNYYRVKIIYQNQKQLYSKLEVIKIDYTRSQCKLFPNPCLDKAHLEFNSDKESLLWVILFDNHGKNIGKTSFPLKKGDNRIILNNVRTLPTGTYHVQVKNEHICQHMKLIKQ